MSEIDPQDVEADRCKTAEKFRRAKAAGPIAKDVLEGLTRQFWSLAVYYAPGQLAENRNANERKYLQFAKLTLEAARALAPYESGRLGSIPHVREEIEHVPAPPVTVSTAVTVNLATLTAEQLIARYRSRVAAGPALQEIEHKPAEPAATVAVNNASNESSEPEPAPGSANVVRWPVWTSGTEARS